MNYNKPFIFDLLIKNKSITDWIEVKSGKVVQKLTSPLTGSDYKIYILSQKDLVLYIGKTKQSLKTRLNGGLKANGKNGYHGYKWKEFTKVRISIWDLKNLNKQQVESIEAELALIVRNKTGKWPELQNEIHFNNDFSQGEEIALKMIEQIKFLNF